LDLVIGGRAADAVEQLAAGIDALLALPRDLDVSGELLRAVEVQRRRLEAVDQQLIADVLTAGQRDALPVLLCADAAEVRARVKRSGDLGPRQAVTGEPLEPILPVTAAAVERGEVSAAQADVIITCLEQIPPSSPASAWPIAEQLLVRAARVEPPRSLRKTATELLRRLDQDGREPIEEQVARKRSFTLIKNPDGSSTARGRLTAEATASWEAIFGSLAAPQHTDDQPDPRTADQRRHDALLEAAQRVLRSADLPWTGGAPVTVLATITMSELLAAARRVAGSGCDQPDGSTECGLDPGAGARAARAGLDPAPDLRLDRLAAEGGLDLAGLLGADAAGLGYLASGQALSASALLHLACDAQVVPVVFRDTGGVLAYGRERRLASVGQRLALAARDGGCTFPGCDRPPAWTEVHHVREWITGGPTDLDNMILICGHHHRTFEKAGWRVHIEDGIPWWTPPPFVDPSQTPIRNTTHHRPEIVFRQPVPA
jgi:hypothetical protein